MGSSTTGAATLTSVLASAVMPGLTFIGDTDTGRGHPSDNQLSLISSSKEIIRINQTAVNITSKLIVGNVEYTSNYQYNQSDNLGDATLDGVYGSFWRMNTKSEVITISQGNMGVQSSANFVPADSFILGVGVVVVNEDENGGGANTWDLGRSMVTPDEIADDISDIEGTDFNSYGSSYGFVANEDSDSLVLSTNSQVMDQDGFGVRVVLHYADMKAPTN